MKKLILLLLTLFSISNTHAQGVALDKKFGNNGIVITDTDPFCDEMTYALACQSDGKILAAGQSGVSGQSYVSAGVIRYHKNGKVDSSFGTNGRTLLVPPANVNAPAKAIAIQKIASTEYILVAGFRVDGSSIHAPVAGYVARLKSDGTLDAGFGTNGMAMLPDANVSNMIVDATGRILLTGYENYMDSPAVMGVFRLLPNGQPDNGFGTNGFASVQYPDYSDATVLALQKDGKIILAGRTWTLPTNDNFDMLVARLKTDGSTDSTFGTNGLVRIDPDTNEAQPAGVALQSDGKIIICATSDAGIGNRFYMTRLLVNGTRDNSFGSVGEVRTNFGNNQAWCKAVLVQKDDKIYLSGYASPTSTQNDYGFAITRYKPNGVVDSTFGVNGRDTTNRGRNSGASAAIITPDNSVIAAGWSYWSQPLGRFDDFMLVKYLSGLETKIADPNNNIQAAVYPNPARGNVNISYTLQQADVLSMQLTDITGRIVKVFTTNENRSAGKHQAVLQIDNTVAPGQYVLQIAGATSQSNIKLTVQ
ncbi:MAG: T9SS type A sorting domain-containing protein [Flavipsychrobacter sp.]